MHKYLGILPLLALTFVTSSAQGAAGGGDSGGGSVVVCRNSAGEIESVQLLDLFEGKIRHRHKHPVLNLHHMEILEGLIPRLSFAHFETNEGHWSFTEELKEELNELKLKSEFLPHGVTLNQPTDLGSSYAIVVPDGCRVEAAGFREADGTFVIASTLYEPMDEVNKAAFWLHEAVYSIYTRSNSLDPSEGTWPIRRLVSTVFARNTDLSHLAEASTFFFRRVDVFKPGTAPNVTSRIFVDLAKADARLTLGYRIGHVGSLAGGTSQISNELGKHFTCEGLTGTVSRGSTLTPGEKFFALVDLAVSQCPNNTADSVFVTISDIINLEGSIARDGQTVMKVTDKSGRLVFETQTNPIVIRRRPVRSTLGIKFNMKMNVIFLRDRATYNMESTLAKFPF